MPIDWAHAFGGPSFDKNPLGMGIELVERNGEKVRPLPNIEPYGALMRSPSEQPDPASLMGMDMSFAQRRNRAGTFGSDYVEKYAPGLPPDHEPTIYNAAAPDQWSDSVWRGDESFVVENMNATTQKLEGSLPGLRTRIFVTHRGRDGQRFVEIPLACDTVWLFPSVGLGAVVFHGSMPITQDDAADIVHLIACCEEPTSPRPIEHYQQALERRLDKDKAALAELSDRDLMPELSSGVAPNILVSIWCARAGSQARVATGASVLSGSPALAHDKLPVPFCASTQRQWLEYRSADHMLICSRTLSPMPSPRTSCVCLSLLLHRTSKAI